MKSKVILTIAIAAFSVALPVMAQAPAAKTPDRVKDSTPKKAVEVAPTPSDKDIADASAKGMVWVNTSTKVYHKDGQFYGKTKRGKFMTEDDAKKAGFRSAQEPVAKNSKKDVKK